MEGLEDRKRVPIGPKNQEKYKGAVGDASSRVGPSGRAGSGFYSFIHRIREQFTLCFFLAASLVDCVYTVLHMSLGLNCNVTWSILENYLQ